MMDETTGSGEQQNATPSESVGQTSAGPTEAHVAFCQQCGRALTAETMRKAGSAVYCESCLVSRLEGKGATGATASGTAGAWNPVGTATPPQGATGGAPYGNPAPPSPGTPSPATAAVLGLIPGVGAMYNEQYAKGLAHLVIFVVLVSFANNVNGIFGLFVAGWIFYQSFEAYHTAVARRDGTPLPNAFGLNDIGDRMGFGRNWPGSASRPVTTAPPGGWAATAAPPPHQPPNWAGYVPPTNFGATAAPPPPPTSASGSPASATPPQSQAWTTPPYEATYAGGASGPWQSGTVPSASIPVPMRRFPAGAAWLIGLGVLFLLSNLEPHWRLRGNWMVPIILAALAIWMIFRRMEFLRNIARFSGEPEGLGPDAGRRLACHLRAPIMLLVLAALFALQAAGAWTLGQSWPWILIVLGALLLIERLLGRGAWYPPVGSSAAAPGSQRTNWATGDGGARKDEK